jgi:hypothetical protein
MRKVYQRYDNDCMRASLATLLNKKYEEIPDFCKDIYKINRTEAEATKLFQSRLKKFYNKNSLLSIVCDVKILKDYIRMPSVSEPLYAIGILYKKRYFAHAVVVYVDKYGIKIVHNPQKNDTVYTIDNLVSIIYLIKK